MRTHGDSMYYSDDKMSFRYRRAVECCGLNVDSLESAGTSIWPKPLMEGQVYYPKVLTPTGHELGEGHPVLAVRNPADGNLIWRLTPGAE